MPEAASEDPLRAVLQGLLATDGANLGKGRDVTSYRRECPPWAASLRTTHRNGDKKARGLGGGTRGWSSPQAFEQPIEAATKKPGV